jgi:hypothetical protein
MKTTRVNPQNKTILKKQTELRKTHQSDKKIISQNMTSPEGLLAMQQMVGNQAVGALVNTTHSEAPLMEAIHAEQGHGNLLPADLKRRLENEFRTSFGSVRIHSDERADALSAAAGAKAFTAGRDIYFRSGNYDPKKPAGLELLRHELAHVVQQGGHFSKESRLGQTGDTHEQQADQARQSAHNLRLLPYSASGLVQRVRDMDDIEDFEVLGGDDHVNQVLKMTHKNNKVGFFKRDPNRENMNDGEKSEMPMSSRSVLQSTVDQTLGLNVASKDTLKDYASEGEKPIIGAESEAVPGEAFMKQSKDVNGHITRAFNRHDFSHPEMQKSLSNLQLEDALMGQRDRHSGNIGIDDASHSAKGFDHDLNFAERDPVISNIPNLHKPAKKNSLKGAAKQARDVARKAAIDRLNHIDDAPDKKTGLPSHIDYNAALRIKHMKSKAFMDIVAKKDPENFRRMQEHSQAFGIDRIQELKDRYSATRRYVKAGFKEGEKRPDWAPNLVRDWNIDTYNAQMKEKKEDLPDVPYFISSPSNLTHRNYLSRLVHEYNANVGYQGGTRAKSNKLSYHSEGSEKGPLQTQINWKPLPEQSSLAKLKMHMATTRKPHNVNLIDNQ